MKVLEKHMLWLQGTAERLVARGLLDAPVSITPKGIAAYDQLVASGWKPAPKLVRRLLREQGVPPEQLDGVTGLFLSQPSNDVD